MISLGSKVNITLSTTPHRSYGTVISVSEEYKTLDAQTEKCAQKVSPFEYAIDYDQDFESRSLDDDEWFRISEAVMAINDSLRGMSVTDGFGGSENWLVVEYNSHTIKYGWHSFQNDDHALNIVAQVILATYQSAQ